MTEKKKIYIDFGEEKVYHSEEEIRKFWELNCVPFDIMNFEEWLEDQYTVSEVWSVCAGASFETVQNFFKNIEKEYQEYRDDSFHVWFINQDFHIEEV